MKMIIKATPSPPTEFCISSLNLQFCLEATKIFEQQICLCLNDRPRWMPPFVWRWMIRTVLRREVHYR